MNQVKRLLVCDKNPNPYIPEPGDWFVWKSETFPEWRDVLLCISRDHGGEALRHSALDAKSCVYGVGVIGYVEYFCPGPYNVEFAQVVPAKSEHLEFKLKG